MLDTKIDKNSLFNFKIKSENLNGFFMWILFYFFWFDTIDDYVNYFQEFFALILWGIVNWWIKIFSFWGQIVGKFDSQVKRRTKVGAENLNLASFYPRFQVFLAIEMQNWKIPSKNQTKKFSECLKKRLPIMGVLRCLSLFNINSFRFQMALLFIHYDYFFG